MGCIRTNDSTTASTKTPHNVYGVLSYANASPFVTRTDEAPGVGLCKDIRVCVCVCTY